MGKSCCICLLLLLTRFLLLSLPPQDPPIGSLCLKFYKPGGTVLGKLRHFTWWNWMHVICLTHRKLVNNDCVGRLSSWYFVWPVILPWCFFSTRIKVLPILCLGTFPSFVPAGNDSKDNDFSREFASFLYIRKE